MATRAIMNNITTKEAFEIVLTLAQEKLNDITEEETFELCGEEVSVVDAMDALALAWDYKNDLIRDGQYYGS